MNDRYLYRAKRIDKGVWVEGNLIHAKKDYYICEKPYECMNEYSSLNGQSYGFGGFKLVDPSTICQCTGLKDKNGKLIWENDIVRFQFDNDYCPFPNKDTKKRIGKVFFSDFRASWAIAMGRNGRKYLNNDLFNYVQNGNRVEVIGNIFDNPELLEVGE